jgi:hypothetical protein
MSAVPKDPNLNLDSLHGKKQVIKRNQRVIVADLKVYILAK